MPRELMTDVLEPGRQPIDTIMPPEEDKGFSLSRTLFNIPGSAIDVVKNTASAVLHPVETGKALGKTVVGGVQKLIPGEQGQEKNFDAAAKYFGDRFGIKEFATGDVKGGAHKLAKTIENDPVGFLLDVASVLSAGGAAVGKVGEVSKLSKIAKVGEVTNAVGNAIDPFSIAGRLANGGIKIAGDVAAEGLGFTTGAGGKVIREAFRNPTPEFTKALRGTTREEDILNSTRDALDTIRENRRNAYRSQLENVQLQQMDLNIDSINTTFNNKLKEFGVKTVVDENGIPTLDFNRSALRSDTAARQDLLLIKSMLDDWGSMPGDRTPYMVDTLKKNLDDFYSDSSNARAIVAETRKAARETLNPVPGYTEMVADYEKATKDIQDIEKTLSLRSTTSNDTAIKKIMSVLRENQDYRQGVLNKLETLGADPKLQQQVAGVALKQGMPRGLVSKVILGAEGLAFYGLNPAVLFLIPASSPRVVGEFVRVLGLTDIQVQRVTELAKQLHVTDPAVRRSVFQAGRLQEQSEPKLAQ